MNNWQEKINTVTNPLPGSVPYTNERIIKVQGKFDKMRLIDFLSVFHTGDKREIWQEKIRKKEIRIKGESVFEEDIVRGGFEILNMIPNTIEPDVSTQIKILFEDEDLLIVDKPAPLPVHPSGRFNKNTLVSILKLAAPKLDLRLAHRLDADTTGLVVLTKNKSAATFVQKQFNKYEVKKHYLALVDGIPEKKEFSVNISFNKKPTTAGRRDIEKGTLKAQTDFKLLKIKNHQSLLEIFPHQGRTNQIRLHLQTVDLPIVGDQAYGENIDLKKGLTSLEGSLCLHAWKLAFIHPIKNKKIEFETKKPSWFLKS